MNEKPSLASLNKSADLGSLPAIWKGQVGWLNDAIKAQNLNVTQEDVQQYWQSRKVKDEELSSYFRNKKRLM